jgi:MarR family transcriptional regulator, organic hydroperoxide resistance regulator
MKRAREGGFLVAQVHQLGGRVFARLLRRHRVQRLNPSQGRIMFVLWKEDGLPIGELGVRTELQKSTLTSMLDRLEAAGLVRREAAPDDRRKILVRRTKKDHALQTQYREVSEEMNRIFYRGLAAAEVEAFEATLRKVLENLREPEVV